MGLLGEIYSFGNRTRNKLRGLFDDPKGYHSADGRPDRKHAAGHVWC